MQDTLCAIFMMTKIPRNGIETCETVLVHTLLTMHEMKMHEDDKFSPKDKQYENMKYYEKEFPALN